VTHAARPAQPVGQGSGYALPDLLAGLARPVTGLFKRYVRVSAQPDIRPAVADDDTQNPATGAGAGRAVILFDGGLHLQLQAIHATHGMQAGSRATLHPQRGSFGGFLRHGRCSVLPTDPTYYLPLVAASCGSLQVGKCAKSRETKAKCHKLRQPSAVNRRTPPPPENEGVVGALDPSGLVVEEPQVVAHEGAQSDLAGDHA
jgi:hypothetical protein